jgi:hypothetical protein
MCVFFVRLREINQSQYEKKKEIKKNQIAPSR